MSSVAAIDLEIDEDADLLTWITTGIFCLSIMASIVRSDPTLAICLFGFYGESLRKHDAYTQQLTYPCAPVWQVRTSVLKGRSGPSGSSCRSRGLLTSCG